MPRKISQLEAATDVTASDLIQIVDIEDTGMAVSGTNKRATAQLMANELGKLTNITATGSTTTRSLANRFADVVNVKDFGAVGNWNGTTGTNNTTAFQNAMEAAAGKKLYIPSGRYLIQFTTNVCFTVPANIVIEGDGDLNTEIIIDPNGFTSAQYPIAFNLNSQGVEFNGIKITAKVATGNNLTLIELRASDVSINRCTLDGNVTHSGSTISHNVFGISHGGGSSFISDNLVIENSKLTRLTYPFLKNNIATSTSNNWKIVGNLFTANYYNDCGLNSPNGIMNNVVIANNTFENNQSIAAGEVIQSLGVALASVKYVSISDNFFSGSYTDAIHIEENSDYITIEGNRFSINNGTSTQCRCVEFNANNVGGVEEKPNHISIIGNAMYQNGPAKDPGTDAIGLIFNPLSQNPASEIIISNNTINNFNRGISSVATVDDSIVIDGNIITNCAVGIALFDGAITISNNITKNCDIGITNGTSSNVYEAATIRDHIFIDCINNISTSDIQIIIINPKFIFSEFTSPAGTSYKTLLPAKTSDRIYGELTMTLTSGSSFNRSYDVEVITWDGTNLTWDDSSSLTPSPTQVSKVKFESGFAISASRTGTTLDVAIFNASSINNNRLQIDLDGSCMIQP
jgi:hypothetical protein